MYIARHHSEGEGDATFFDVCEGGRRTKVRTLVNLSRWSVASVVCREGDQEESSTLVEYSTVKLAEGLLPLSISTTKCKVWACIRKPHIYTSHTYCERVLRTVYRQHLRRRRSVTVVQRFEKSVIDGSATGDNACIDRVRSNKRYGKVPSKIPVGIR